MADSNPSFRRPAFLGVVVVITAAAVLWWFAGGGLGHRSVAETKGSLPIPADVDTLRLELQNGTIGIDSPQDPSSAPVVDYAGGVRRAADSATELQQIEQVAVVLTPVPDASRPRTLVLRGPVMPAGVSGLLALDLGIRVPAGLNLEIVITGNGHITLGNRAGHSVVATGRGDLRFERCKAAIRAKSGYGNVIAFDHEGDLDLFTSAGDMQAFVRKPGEVLRLATGKGTVQCGVPEDCEFDLDGRAATGKIGADFGLAAEKVGEFGAAVVGKRGSARTKVVLRTETGHLAFRAKKFG